jgi:flavin-dependent thymidylate synthase
MKVKLRSIQEDAVTQLLYAKNIRLGLGDEAFLKVATLNQEEVERELEYAAKTIPSSWEFVSYTWEILGITVACGRQLTRFRNWTFAQESQRVTDMSNFEVYMPPSISALDKEGLWTLTVNMIKSSYVELRKAGVPAQDARGLLPMNSYTNLLARTDLSNFAKACGKRINLRAQDEMSELMCALREEVYRVHPWTHKFIEPERKRTPAIIALFKFVLGDRPATEVPEVTNAQKELDLLKETWG